VAISNTKKWSDKPRLVLLFLLILIALAECLVMYLLGMAYGHLAFTTLVIIDALLLVCVLYPVLYKLVFYPLVRQISERAAAESAFRASKAKYRQLIDSVEGIVWEADPVTFAFSFVSKRAEDILGYPSQKWMEEPTFWADHLHPDDRGWAIDSCVSATHEKQDHVFEYRMIAADGRVVWLRDLVTVIIEGGELTSLRGLMVDVTERKNTELALVASEQRHQFLADSLHDVIWELDSSLCYIYVSYSVHKMFGYRADELVGKPFSVVMTDESVRKVHEILREISTGDHSSSAGQVTVSQGFECLRKDGALFPAEVSATLIFSPDGTLETVVGSTRDVSDRKLAEAGMNAAHDLLEKTINSICEAVVIVDADTGSIKDCNRATETIFGYAREELLGAHVSVLHVSSELHAHFHEDMQRHMVEQGSFTSKFRMKRKSGWVFPSEQTFSPISLDGAENHHYVCVVRDISAQVLHEEELNRAYNMVAERNTFVESVITSIQSGIIVLDPDLNITMINPYAADICKRDSDELVGMSLLEVCPELYDQVTRGSEPDEILATFFGVPIIIGYASFLVKNARGRVTGTILTFKDLSEVIKIRKEMRQKQRLSAMGEVVARVAHEMRNPLFGMTSAVQILNMELQLNSAQQVLMDSFLKESRRLNNLVEELLTCTREVRLSRKSVNLVDVINDSLRLVAETAAEWGVSITAADVGGDIRVHADHDKLEQVLLNLLKNGIEACVSGGRVDLSIRVDGVNAMIEVVDTGSGIPADAMEAIFDVFYTTKKNGTGMGLSISKNIVEAHGGELTAYNREGGGAAFVMTIPLQVAAE